MSTNLALNKPATASSYVAPFSPSRVVNGQLAPVQRWVCDVLPAEFTVDLGEYYIINSIILKFMETVGWDSRYNVKGFTIEGSTDNRNWDTWQSISGNTASSVTLPITSRPARWVKMKVNPGWGLGVNLNAASLVEMEVYESTIDPYLSNLTISSGTLSPAFNKRTFGYDVSVPSSTQSVTVTPTADDPSHASIKVNNQTVSSGSPSQAISLSPGVNTITIMVSNQGIQQSYTIKVVKLSSTVVYLTGLNMKDSFGPIDLQPQFSQTTQTYITEANGDAVTAQPSSPGNTIKVNGQVVNSGSWSNPINLNMGNNDVTVSVTPAAGGSETIYTIHVNRIS